MYVCDLNIEIDDSSKWLGIDASSCSAGACIKCISDSHILLYYTAAEVKWNVFNGKCLESFWQ